MKKTVALGALSLRFVHQLLACIDLCFKWQYWSLQDDYEMKVEVKVTEDEIAQQEISLVQKQLQSLDQRLQRGGDEEVLKHYRQGWAEDSCHGIVKKEVKEGMTYSSSKSCFLLQGSCGRAFGTPPTLKVQAKSIRCQSEQ